MLYMIWTISLRRMWEHKLRTALTIIGIALGVAGYIAVQMITDTLQDSFSHMIDQVAGRVQLEVYGSDAGVDESVLKQLEGMPELSVALPVIQVTTKDIKNQSLLLLAVDTLNDKAARDYKMKDASGVEISDPLLFLNSQNAILLNRDFARRNNIKIDQTMELMTTLGNKTFVVRGLLEAEGAAQAFGGNFALMDVYSAQILFSRQGKFDQIDLILKPDQDLDKVREKIGARLGGRYDILRPQQRTQGVDSMMTTFNLGLSVMSMVVLAMGIFIIINTVMTSVLQRKREIGIQRMVGVTRAGIWSLFALEGVLFGLIGSLIGIVAGFFMGREAVLHFATKISSLFVMVDLSKVSFHPGIAVEGVALGVLVSLLASLYPSWRATRITPLEVLTYDHSLSVGQGIVLWRWLLLLVPASCMIVYLIFAPLGFVITGTRIMMVSIFLASISVTPFVMTGLLRLVRRLTAGQSSALLRLATENILRDLGRAAMTVAAFMVGLAVMVEIYLFVNSTKTNTIEWINEALTADLMITNSTKVASREVMPITPDLGLEIERMPGVDSVATFRLLMTDYDKARIAILSFDLNKHFNKARFRFKSGNKDAALDRMRHNEAVLLTQNLVLRHNLEDATSITLDTPTGKKTYPVAGVVMDYTSEHGAVMINRDLYVQDFKDPLVDTFQVYLKPGADLLKIRDQIFQTQVVQKNFNLYVLTNKEFRQTILQAIDQLFALAYSLEVLAMLIAFIGIVNNLMATVVDRTREIGVLRAVGATRPQIAWIFLSQAGLLGLSGVLISIFAGFGLGKVQLTRINQIYAGWAMPLAYNWSQLVPLLIAAIIVGLIAGVVPARMAARLTLHEALKYE